MRIKKVQFKNGYKKFKDLTIDLGDNPSKIIALVGPNGCGKSSVFDGMLFLNNAYQPIGQFGQKDYKFHSMEGTQGFSTENVSILFDNGDFSAIRLKKQSEGKQNTIFNYRNPYRYNSNLNVSTLKTISDIKNNSIGASSSIDLDDKMVDNYQRLYVYITDYRKSNGLTDKQAKDQIIGELNEILNKCLGLEISDEGDILSGKGSLYFKKPSQPKEFDFNVLSSGEKEIVDILLDLYLKRREFGDTIYIIDEPELHLSTGIQKKLLIEIEKIIPDNCQLWIATHSIGFLTALKENLDDKCSVIEFNGNYAAESAVLNPIKKNRNNWQKLLQIALEDLAGLLAPKNIIYCEGRFDPGIGNTEQGLDADIYNEIFSEVYPDTLFISSGGDEVAKNTSLALKVLNKTFKDVGLFLLKDRDDNTEKERESFINKNLINRMLKRREIENYIFDKEILKKFCSEKGIIFNEEEYDKDVVNICQQKLKPIQQKIQHNCGETGDLDAFKCNLAKVVSKNTLVFKELNDIIFSENEK